MSYEYLMKDEEICPDCHGSYQEHYLLVDSRFRSCMGGCKRCNDTGVVKRKEYEETCQLCHGRKYLEKPWYGPRGSPSEKCPRCKGTGKIVWIDKIKKGIRNED